MSSLGLEVCAWARHALSSSYFASRMDARSVCPVDTGLGFVDLASHSWSQLRNDLEAVLDNSTFGNSSGNSMIVQSEACKSHRVA